MSHGAPHARVPNERHHPQLLANVLMVFRATGIHPGPDLDRRGVAGDDRETRAEHAVGPCEAAGLVGVISLALPPHHEGQADHRCPLDAERIERDSIGELAEKHGRLRIASVGCGPAREIRALANDSPGLLQKLDILLLDQDERALEDCRRALEETGVPGAAVELVRASVEELTEPGSRADLLLGQRDFIYSAGLFDYFNDQNFERYLRAMYGHLAPGGQIVIGNISSESPDRWLLEYVTDWFLYHRSVADLQKYRELLTPPPSFYSVESEETGINLFLVARSPRD